MSNNRPLRVNLASEPLRNVRFFRTLFVALVVLLAGAASLAAGLFIGQQVRDGRLAREAASLRRSVETARLETKRLESRAREMTARDRSTVDFANDLILRKSFSWVDLLYRLEQALPASSAVVSLAPTAVGGARAEVSLKAVFRNLNDLLAFIRNLYSRGFTQVRLASEGRNDLGQLEAEITVVYEGTF